MGLYVVDVVQDCLITANECTITDAFFFLPLTPCGSNIKLLLFDACQNLFHLSKNVSFPSKTRYERFS